MSIDSDMRTQRIHIPPSVAWKCLLGILFFAIVFRVVTIEFFMPEVVSDAKDYMKMATHAYHGERMQDTYGNYAFMSPGYPMFLVPIFSMFGNNLRVALYTNVVLACIALVLLYFCGKYLYSSLVGILASSFWAVYAPSMYYSAYMNKENLMIPLLLGQFFCLLKMLHRIQEPSENHSNMFKCICFWTVCYGVLTGFHLLVGTVSAVFIPIAIVVWMRFPFSFFKRLVVLSIFLCTIFLVLFPWLLRNANVIGKFVIVTNAGFNLFLGNNPNAGPMGVSLYYTDFFNEFNRIRIQKGEYEAEQEAKRRAIEYIKQNPLRTLKLAIEKIVVFWTPPLHDGRSMGSLAEDLLRAVWFSQYLLIMMGAFACVFFVRPWAKNYWLLWCGILLYNFIHGVFYIIFRYRLPIMPHLILLAMTTLVIVFERYGKAKSQ